MSVERFRREIAMSARLQHPHIVPLLTAGETDGLPYYTMPFVDGESLRARLAREGELPLVDVVRVLRDVAGALAYAHEHGVVHRDIKPENVLLTRQHALVTDFGVAKALSASSTMGAGVERHRSASRSARRRTWRPSRRPPIRRRTAAPTSTRSARWRTRCSRAHLRSPGATRRQTLAAHAHGDAATPVTTRRPATPPALAALVMQLLEKRPADRPQTAESVLRVLDGVTTTSGSMLPFAPSKREVRVPAWAIAAVARGTRRRRASLLVARRGKSSASRWARWWE